MPCHIYPLGDQAIVIDWGNRIDTGLNQQVRAVHAHLRDHPLPGIRDLIPAYSSLTILLDLGELLQQSPGRPPFEMMRTQLDRMLPGLENRPVQEGRRVDIPVCYDPSLAPDLETVAGFSGMHTSDVVEMHAGREYLVYLLGFLPGFAYMGSVDARIAAPRRPQPRSQVPAGSVGIAGEQTGIYPLQSPGGWNLIGRTPLRLFDPHRPEPALLQAGDRVRFFAISLQAFQRQMHAP